MVVTAETEQLPSDGTLRSGCTRNLADEACDLCVLCELLQAKQEAAERKITRH